MLVDKKKKEEKKAFVRVSCCGSLVLAVQLIFPCNRKKKKQKVVVSRLEENPIRFYGFPNADNKK